MGHRGHWPLCFRGLPWLINDRDESLVPLLSFSVHYNQKQLHQSHAPRRPPRRSWVLCFVIESIVYLSSNSQRMPKCINFAYLRLQKIHKDPCWMQQPLYCWSQSPFCVVEQLFYILTGDTLKTHVHQMHALNSPSVRVINNVDPVEKLQGGCCHLSEQLCYGN